MHPLIVGAIVFGCAFVATLLGMWLRTMSPEHHLNAESRDAVKLGISLVATMIALVLGLVTASAKNSFDAVAIAVSASATHVLALDRLLARYGPETREIRAALQHTVARRLDMVWPQGASRPVQFDPSGVTSGAERLVERIRTLAPADAHQQSLHARAVDIAERFLEDRWMAFTDSGASIPMSFLVVMMFWLTITFACYGILAPRNTTIFAVHFFCAVCVGSAFFLILEMDGPFEGVLRVSADPLRYAVAHINQ
jgi:Protein of unknown function (DUF4239)